MKSKTDIQLYNPSQSVLDVYETDPTWITLDEQKYNSVKAGCNELDRLTRYELAKAQSSYKINWPILIVLSLCLAGIFAFIGTAMEYNHRERIILYQRGYGGY